MFCDAVPVRRTGDQQPIQIVPADQSVFRLPVPAGEEAPRARRPAWLALVAGAVVVALVFAVAHRGKGVAVPAPTTSSSTSSTTTVEAVQRPPQIGVEAPPESAVSFRLVLTPKVARVHDLVTVTIDGRVEGLGNSPMMLTLDDRIGGFWRTLVWFVGAPPGGGPFVSGVVLGQSARPPADVSIPTGPADDAFQVQVEGLTAGEYRVCRRFPRLGELDPYYVCTVLTVIP
jgi:hypothetical protein